MTVLSKYPIHPFLMSAYPVALLLTLNQGEVQPADAVRALVISVILAATIYGLLWLILRRVDMAAALASLYVLLFFSYGHVYELVRGFELGGLLLGRHRFMLLLWILAVLSATWYVVRKGKLPQVATTMLNMAAIALLIVPLVQLASSAAQEIANNDPGGVSIQAEDSVKIPTDTPPDVYYIILDAYTRGDVLREVYEYDNSSFLESLEALGFTIADDSRSNYAVTRLSVPSALNLNYIETFGPPLDPDAKDAAWLDQATKGNVVSKTFHDLGYQIVAFDSGYGMTNWTNTDLYLSPRPLSLSDQRAFSDLSDFEVLLLQTSVGRLAVDFNTVVNSLFGTDVPNPNAEHQERILFALDRIGRLPEIPGPKFVFIHIMSPHPPYIFGEDVPANGGGIFTLAGSSGSIGEIEGYRSQVAFLNSRLVEGLETLLENSEQPPIIVIQGDHGGLGVSPEDRMKILNGYFLPGEGKGHLYEGISPVNTFRLIFSAYFGADLPRLEDLHYYSSLDRPFDLMPIP